MAAKELTMIQLQTSSCQFFICYEIEQNFQESLLASSPFCGYEMRKVIFRFSRGDNNNGTPLASLIQPLKTKCSENEITNENKSFQ